VQDQQVWAERIRPGALLNLVDQVYAYDDPDHWSLPADTDQIPYTFEETRA